MTPIVSHHTPRATEVLPRGVLVAIGVLLLVSMAGTAVVRLSGISIREPDAAVVASRLLRFEDGPEGSVIIMDATTNVQIARMVGEQGFLRGAMRALARGRRMAGIGAQPAFELVARADGRLTLLDPANQQRIDLESFGPTNAAVFAALLHGAKPPTPRSP
jgi:putative photosynthetic complex assembly protein